MTKLEFDEGIFERAYNEGTCFKSVVQRHLELAQEPPKRNFDIWINLYLYDGDKSSYYSINSDDDSSSLNRVARRHLRYNHDTGRIEDITEEEDDNK